MFKWKYPVWYSKNIFMNDCTLFETARSGIWYTDNISLTNCIVEAPKTFRRASNIKLKMCPCQMQRKLYGTVEI